MSGKLIGGFKAKKARKEYICDICDKPIHVGETYIASFCVDDEKHAWSNHEHVHCHNMMIEYCGKCPDRSDECWDSDCLEHALIDSVCDGCKDKTCPNLPSRCDKIWELAKAKYGEVKK